MVHGISEKDILKAYAGSSKKDAISVWEKRVSGHNAGSR